MQLTKCKIVEIAQASVYINIDFLPFLFNPFGNGLIEDFRFSQKPLSLSRSDLSEGIMQVEALCCNRTKWHHWMMIH